MLQPLIPPAKEFEIDVTKDQPEWVGIFERAKTLAQKYSVLKPHLYHLRNNPFLARLSIPERQLTINLPSTVFLDKPESLLDLFLT